MQLRVNEYAQLRDYIRTFNQGKLDILILEGSAGTGKSSLVRQAMKSPDPDDKESPFWLEGRTTAAALYHRLYENRDRPIIIDDVDGLYRDKDSVNLLKCLCQTEKEKMVMWNSMAKIRDGENTPTQFTTTSKVCIITNSWKTLNRHVGAVQDRGLLILFHPSTTEVHRYVNDELKHNPEVYDEEVFEFIGLHLKLIKDHSIRHYRNAMQLKQADMNWREVLVESFGLSEKEMLVLKLQDNDTLSHNDRAKEFAETLQVSERTYWRIKKDLHKKGMQFDSHPSDAPPE